MSGMGADFRDIDNDGYDDLWVTGFEGDTFPLFRNRGAAGISRRSPAPPGGRRHAPHVGLVEWHCRFRQRWLEGLAGGARARAR
jgi:hypothetical protein